jgi:hypothetical protein
MPVRKDVARPALKVFFEMLSLFHRFECDIELDFPRRKLGSVWTFSRIMINKSPTKVGRMANVTLVRMTQALNYVCVEHGLPSIAWNLIGAKSSFAEPMEDILRLEPSLPLRFQAKDGGVGG